MTADRGRSTDHLTFSQLYGYQPLPEPMRREEISDDLRREIWNAVRATLIEKRQFGYYDDDYSFCVSESKFIERVLGRFLKRAENKIPTDYAKVMSYFQHVVTKSRFDRLLDLIEIMIDERYEAHEFVGRIKNSFEKNAAAYWLDTSLRPYRFVPCASKEQGEATRQAIETIREGGMDGASEHLRKAAERINAREYGDSIRESVHAVESVARRIAPGKRRSLASALDSLENVGLLKHPKLKEAFKKLYDYASDEPGVRHARLKKGAPQVGQGEAMFMFGACASFAAYLTDKHRQVGEREADGG